MYAFEASNVVKEFRLEGHAIRVLNGVDLQIPRGEWSALVGPSGSGKTTLLHLLGALDEPSSGEICCQTVRYRQLSASARSALRRKTIGFVFQSYHLFPELSAVENVALPGLYWGNNKELVHQRAHDLLRSFALGHRLHHRPPELSGGEQQRVALARALINDPDIVMADEPTGNLDADSGREIIDALELLHRQQHKTILMVTHDLAIARRADRILRMQDGRVAPFTPA